MFLLASCNFQDFLLFLLNDLIPRNYQFGKLQIKIKKQRIIGFCTALLHVFFLYNALEKISQLCKFSIQAKAEITSLFEFVSKFSLKYYVRSMQYVSRPFKLQSHTYHVLTIHMVNKMIRCETFIIWNKVRFLSICHNSAKTLLKQSFFISTPSHRWL